MLLCPWDFPGQKTGVGCHFLRPEDWSGVPFPSPGDLPDPGIEPGSPAALALQVVSFPLSQHRSLWSLGELTILSSPSSYKYDSPFK